MKLSSLQTNFWKYFYYGSIPLGTFRLSSETRTITTTPCLLEERDVRFPGHLCCQWDTQLEKVDHKLNFWETRISFWLNLCSFRSSKVKRRRQRRNHNDTAGLSSEDEVYPEMDVYGVLTVLDTPDEVEYFGIVFYLHKTQHLFLHFPTWSSQLFLQKKIFVSLPPQDFSSMFLNTPNWKSM